MSAKKIVTFKPGELVIEEKRPCTALYIVKEGQLEVYRVKGDHRIPLGIISSGEYIGETALLLDRPHGSNVIALTEVKALMLPREAIDAQLKLAPPWLLALTRGLVERLRSANETLRRNDLVDEKMSEKVTAIENSQKATEENNKSKS